MDAIRTPWFDHLLEAIQGFSLRIAVTDRDDLRGIVDQFSRELPAAPDRLHDPLLALTLGDVCQLMFEAIHGPRRRRPCRCAEVGWGNLALLLHPYQRDPRQAFAQWAHRLLEAFEREHPPSAAEQVASMIRRYPARPWTVGDMASLVSAPGRRLSLMFRREFGIGPVQYLHLARVARALEGVERRMKIEAVATEAGYRSRKDFYRAFRLHTGLTPGGFQRLAPEARAQLQFRLGAALSNRAPAGPPFPGLRMSSALSS